MNIEIKITDLEEKKSNQIFDLVVILDNLRSSHNVGNIYRLAEALNIKAIYPCGYTAYPPHPKITKTARNTENDTPTFYYQTTIEACQKLKNKGYKLIGIETTRKSSNLWEYKFTEKSALVLGNEALGINEEILTLCDTIIELPLFGRKNSINVSNCASIVLFKAIQDIN